MNRLVKLFFIILTMTTLGLSFIPNDKKPFISNNSFTPQHGIEDYRQLWASLMERSIFSENVLCDETILVLRETHYSKNTAVQIKDFILNGSSMYWIFSIPRPEESINENNRNLLFPKLKIQGNQEIPENISFDSGIEFRFDSGNSELLAPLLSIGGVWYFDVPINTAIIAPSQFYMTNYNNDVFSAYPSYTNSPGVHAIGWVLSEKVATVYRITFSSLDRLWCCHEKPVSTPSTYFAHEHLSKDSRMRLIPAGAVIGFSGVSSLNTSERDLISSNDEFVTTRIGVSIERFDIISTDNITDVHEAIRKGQKTLPYVVSRGLISLAEFYNLI